MAGKCSVFFKFLVPGFNKRLTILMLNILAHNLQLKVLSVGVFKRLVSQMIIYETFDSINQWEEKSLPVAFCSSLSEKKLDKAVIKSCLGSWCVRLSRSVDGVLSFEEGWEVFVNHHGLNLGEMVVFEHKGKMVFNAVAYESLGNEKEYELQSDKHPHDYKGKRTLKGTASSTPRTLFSTTMSKSHGNPLHAYMTIPAKFARTNGIVAASRIILKDPSGRSWPLIISKWERMGRRSHRIAARKGWYKFYEANKLKNGDVCIFNLKPVSSKSGSKSTRVLEVQITRCGS
ncbi:B3 domain-containing protein REM8-like isoform X1 [Prunus avium]|uniref:B3 domain-containing protein REM8-like isoform X1 n=1 Tax=Prunus avium TaxID=42229 RepID=A0A6P5SSS4_PRUAV|nr:B3 domain-containing protein REM8-like isoform X1 [Prunus avium]